MKQEKQVTQAGMPVAEEPADHVDRRSFLGRAAGLGAAGLFVSSAAAQQTHRLPVPTETSCADEAIGPEKATKRRKHCFQVRMAAAKDERDAPPVCHDRNDDEALYADRRASYSKGLVHDALGEVAPTSFAALLTALESGDPADFEAIPMGNPGGAGPAPGNTPVHKLINPQSGLAFDLEGADCHAMTVPAAPPFASAWQASEGMENTWMAHLRDVPFRRYATDPLAATAIADLNAASDFRGAKIGGLVTPQTLFRDPFPGCTLGPYLSQFWYRPQPFGTQDIDPRSNTYAAGIDYLTNAADWLARQNGVNPANSNVPGGLVYMRNGRDIGAWVHVDVLFQAYFQAFLVLASSGVPANPGNPYHGSLTQVGFGTFGGPHFATILCEVATRALKSVWFTKWFLHRRMRPEVFLGRVHFQLSGAKDYGIHSDVLNSAAVAESFSRNGTYLLPTAFPEGSPAHPSYGAGHATVAGACATLLKALFDTELPVSGFFPVVEPDDTGATLVPYGGADASQMTIAGELNKLASNVATGRNIAGVHWRTDGNESMRLGEEIAIRLLRNQAGCYNEPFAGFTFTKFDGTTVTV
jgi:hypothetical protein